MWVYYGVLALHLIGLALGIGASTSSDVLLLRLVRSSAVLDKSAFRSLRLLSRVIWTGIGLSVVSGLTFVLLPWVSDVWVFTPTPLFWVKMGTVLVVLLNGVFVHLHVFPILRSSLGLPFRDVVRKHTALFGVVGAVSGVSWYMTLVLGVLVRTSLPAGFFVLVYIAALVLGGIGSYTMLSLQVRKRDA